MVRSFMIKKVNKKVAIAFKKRNWVLTPVEINVNDEEAVPEDVVHTVTSRFYVEIKHDDDVNVEDPLIDFLLEDEDIIEYKTVKL